MSKVNAIIRPLASLRLAAVLLMMLLVSMAYATMYEQRHGLEHTLFAIYEHPWFQLILGLLAMNTLLALVVRWPFDRRQIGFVITHGAVLVILGGAVVTGVYGERGHVTLREGETRSVFHSQRLVLTARNHATGEKQAVAVNLSSDRPVDAPRVSPLTLGEMSVRVRRYLPDAVSVRRMLNDNPQPSLAVRVSIRDENHETSGWVFHGTPARAEPIRVDVRPLPADASLKESVVAAAQSVDPRAFAAVILAWPDGAMHVVFSPSAGEPTGVPVVVGGPVPTPWGSITLTVLERLDYARTVDALEARIPPGDPPRPALELEISQGEARLELGLGRGIRRTVQLGEDFYDLEYGPEERPLGFELTLDEFRVRTYPGIMAPRSYESDVRIRDAQTGQMLGGRVSMNAPLSYGGYDLFQTSYRIDRSGTYSTLSVVHDPGMWIVFAGYGLAILGMIVVLITRITVYRKGRSLMMERPAE
jgi:hypothetical protein